MVQRIIGLFFIGISLMGNAKDLHPPELKIKLEQLPVLKHQSTIVPLKISIANCSHHRGSILVPYAQNFGKSLFKLRVFEIGSSGNYNLIFTSKETLDMDTSKYKTECGFWHLEPGEVYSFPLFLNDQKNSRKRFESSIQLPPLKNGRYAFQVLYMPENSSFFKYAFRTDFNQDPIPEDDVKEYPDHFFYNGTFVSQKLEIEIGQTAQLTDFNHQKLHSFCKSIHREKWKRIKKNWDKKFNENECNSVLWKYDFYQAMNMSLPAFNSFDVIFYTQSGITYTTFTYQFGKIYRTRSRLAWLFYAMGFRRPPFETSTTNWTKLIRISVRD